MKKIIYVKKVDRQIVGNYLVTKIYYSNGVYTTKKTSLR